MQGTLKSYDAAKAKEYWAKGVAELGGKAPQLTLVLDDNTENKDVGTYLQSQFRSVLGIDVKLDSKTKEARRDLMKAGTYQMGLNAWGADYNDPMTYLQIWTENKNAFRGNFKDTDAANDYAKLIQSAHGEKDNAKRADLLVQAEKSLITDNAVVAPLYYMGSAYLIKSNVSNLIEPNSGILELKYVTVQ
jgi:ABC-type oligopeptide transport system, periplasmic component